MAEKHTGGGEERRVPPGVKEKYWRRLQEMRLLDDALMCAALDGNIPGTELILRIILEKPDLSVISVQVQREYKNLYGRSLVLDVEATDHDNKRYDLEIQRAEAGAQPERARFHSAMMDAHALKAREDFRLLPETYTIFLTESDFWRCGLPVYHIDRTVRETGAGFGDRAHIVYVNGAYQGQSEIGKLMEDFRATDPERMHFRELAERVEDLKTSMEGVRKCAVRWR